MKYKLLKKIEGINLNVGDVFDDFATYSQKVSPENRKMMLLSTIDLHNLLLNGTIEKVEENDRWRAEDGEEYWYITECIFVETCYERDFEHNREHFESKNYFRTEQEAQQVAEQIKELLKKHHEQK